jgi:uncharacterized iron-regulated protein
MRRLFVTPLAALLGFVCMYVPTPDADAQNAPVAYQLFDRKHKRTTWSKLVAEARQADVVLFGELHNNPICHWLQLELAQALAEDGTPVVVGMEMYETDQQEAIDQLYAGTLNLEAFDTATRHWPNYATDYRPLVEWAHQLGEYLVATNIPRKYASSVFRQGLQSLEALPAEERALFCNLPLVVDYNLPQYQRMMEMMQGHNAHADSASVHNFVNAQAIKDATMAQRILQNLPQNGVFLHLNGSFHSDYREGIVWYLLRERPQLRVLVISAAEQDPHTEGFQAVAEQNIGRGDYLLAIPTTMTKTY